MRNRELIKILFIPTLICIFYSVVFIKNYNAKEQCKLSLASLNSFYEISNSPVKKGLNAVGDKSYFVFKTAGGNSLMYYLLVEKNKGYELHEFFQFGGWKSQYLEIKQGKMIFDKLKNLFTEPVKDSKLFHSSCAVTEYRFGESTSFKLINDSHPLSNEIMKNIFHKREGLFNKEEHLVRMLDTKRNFLKSDFFAELGRE